MVPRRQSWGCSIALIFVATLIAGTDPICAQGSVPATGDPQFCGWWQAKVTGDLKPKRTHDTVPSSPDKAADALKTYESLLHAEVYDPDQVAALTDEQVIAAISCLLQLENDNRNTVFVGGPRIVYVSQMFGPAPVKLAALLYISYLFTRNLNLFTAVALRGPGAESNRSQWEYATSNEAIAKAYASYRNWYERVKNIGLARAREQKLDPLEGTGLRWY